MSKAGIKKLTIHTPMPSFCLLHLEPVPVFLSVGCRHSVGPPQIRQLLYQRKPVLPCARRGRRKGGRVEFVAVKVQEAELLDPRRSAERGIGSARSGAAASRTCQRRTAPGSGGGRRSAWSSSGQAVSGVELAEFDVARPKRRRGRSRRRERHDRDSCRAGVPSYRRSRQVDRRAPNVHRGLHRLEMVGELDATNTTTRADRSRGLSGRGVGS